MRRKSELGNLVAANMAGIMESDEHRNLFRKQAGCAADCECPECTNEDDAEASDGACKCPKECEKCRKNEKCSGEGTEKGCPCPDTGSVDDSFADDGKKDKKDKDDDKKDKKDDDKKDAKCTCEDNCKKCMSFGRKCTGDCPCASKKDKDDDKKDKKDDKKDKKDDDKKDKKKDKKSMFGDLFESVLKMSETLDELGLEKSASSMILMADYLLKEANDEVEQAAAAAAKDPGVDATTVVLTETEEGVSEEGGEGELFDPRLMALEFEDEAAEETAESELPTADDIVAQLDAMREEDPLTPKIEAIEQMGKEGPDIGFERELSEEDVEEALKMPGLEGLGAVEREVDVWLKKHSTNKGEIELDADLSALLTTADKEVEDYLIDKNLSFEDES